MLSQEEFIELYTKTTPQTREAVNRILTYEGKTTPEVVMQIIDDCGIDWITHDEVCKAMKSTV